MTRKLLVAVAAVLGGLTITSSAQALTTVPVWQCRGSATYSSVAGQNRVEPIVANGNINTANGGNPDRAQCVNSETGAGNTATQLGISPDFLGAVTGKALTTITPELGFAISQKAAAEGRVEDLQLLVGAGGPTLGIGAANSTATGTCVLGSITPVFGGDSRVADITLGGNPIPLDQLTTQLTNALNPILGAVVEIKVDERIATPTSLTIRALHIKVIKGTTPLLDLVVGEAKVGANGDVCDPTKQGGGSGSVCPAGSELDVERNVCIIRASTSGSSLGDIIVGRPFEGPSGGTVVPIDIARKRFGRTPCLSGNGAPKFAIVGTNGGPHHRHERRGPGPGPRRQRRGQRRTRQRLPRGRWRPRHPVGQPRQRRGLRAERQRRAERRGRQRPPVGWRRPRHDQRRLRRRPHVRRRGQRRDQHRDAGSAGDRELRQRPRQGALQRQGAAGHPRLRDAVHDPRPVDARRYAGGAGNGPARGPPGSRAPARRVGFAARRSNHGGCRQTEMLVRGDRSP